jgi:hypothetical protein
MATEKGSADVRGTLTVLLNGKPAQRLELTPENNDLLQQFAFKTIEAGSNQVEIRFEGKGSLAYQLVGNYFLPWDQKPPFEPLSIDVAYDRTHLAQNDLAIATATIKNNLDKTAKMVMVDLGIPPGFDLLSRISRNTWIRVPAATAVTFPSSASRRLRPFSILTPLLPATALR